MNKDIINITCKEIGNCFNQLINLDFFGTVGIIFTVYPFSQKIEQPFSKNNIMCFQLTFKQLVIKLALRKNLTSTHC
jgi:hypothetical protein